MSEDMIDTLKNETTGNKIGFTGVSVVLGNPVTEASFTCESDDKVPEGGFSRIVLKLRMGCNRKNKHADWDTLVGCEIDIDTDYKTKKWPLAGEKFQQTVEFSVTAAASSLKAFSIFTLILIAFTIIF